MQSVSIGPKPLMYLILLAAFALGVALAWYGPDPFITAIDGGRPSKLLAIIKWGGALIALLCLWRVLVLKRVTAGPDGIVIASWLGSKRHEWSDLTDYELDRALGSPPGYRLRFGKTSMFLLRREYSPAAIASLRDVVKAHKG